MKHGWGGEAEGKGKTSIASKGPLTERTQRKPRILVEAIPEFEPILLFFLSTETVPNIFSARPDDLRENVNSRDCALQFVH